MNKFGQRSAHFLVGELRKEASELPPEHDRLKRLLQDAAGTVEAGNGYFGAVESALA
jgi:hypothetical protein